MKSEKVTTKPTRTPGARPEARMVHVIRPPPPGASLPVRPTPVKAPAPAWHGVMNGDRVRPAMGGSKLRFVALAFLLGASALTACAKKAVEVPHTAPPGVVGFDPDASVAANGV